MNWIIVNVVDVGDIFVNIMYIIFVFLECVV